MPIHGGHDISIALSGSSDTSENSLKNGAPGYEEINNKILQLSVTPIIGPQSFLCNRSLTEGVFPLELKLANVLPLFKSGETMLFYNYRPVSLLCTLSKVFEKIMYSRSLNFLDYHKILIGNQFRFRKLHCSYMALMLVMGQVTKALDNGECVIVVFLNFSKAFDTFNHSTLIDKLYYYGNRGNAVEWFRSFFFFFLRYVFFCIRYRGVIVGNAILKNKINPDISEFLFAKACILYGNLTL